VGLKEAVAPYLLRGGLLLRLAVLVQAPCIWNIELALPIHPFALGGSGISEGQGRFTCLPGSVGSLLVVLRAVVAPNYPGAAPLCPLPGCLVLLSLALKRQRGTK
jgi:hypothetical protein